YLAALTEGTLLVFFDLAQTASLINVANKEQLPAVVAMNEVTYSTTMLLGPPLSGALYSLGQAFPFLADAISYIVSVCSLLFIKVKFYQERSTLPRRLHIEIVEGLKWLW